MALNRIEFLWVIYLREKFRVIELHYSDSQGACLTAEFVARHPRRYAAVIAFTGALIGPPGTARNYAGSLHGTPVFLGTGDPDPHVPFEQVKETAAVLKRLGAEVELRLYCGLRYRLRSMPHHHYQQRLLLLARKIAVRFCTEFFDSLAYLPSGEVDIVRHRRPRQQGGQLRVIALNPHTIE